MRGVNDAVRPVSDVLWRRAREELCSEGERVERHGAPLSLRDRMRRSGTVSNITINAATIHLPPFLVKDNN